MTTEDSHLDLQTRLIHALQNPACYPHPVGQIQLLETHISWVILTGDYVYKFKKSLNLGFLDYSTLEKRHYFCKEELRLNRRTAPELYLDVIPVSGSPTSPLLGDASDPIEYAVKMRQFPQDALLSQLLKKDELTSILIDQLADVITSFHAEIQTAPPDSTYGLPEMILQPVQENFNQIREQFPRDQIPEPMQKIEQWALSEYQHCRPLMLHRHAAGFIRECHGDLHLNNITLLDHRPVLFDAIEFNPNLRYIDTISETAFLIMDLEANNRSDLAWRLLNHCLEKNGDYNAVPLLRFYLCYRAMVRAKINAIRTTQQSADSIERTQGLTEFYKYLDLADTYTRNAHNRLLITHGLSGSGKTVLSQQLLENWPAIRLRSDVERKRLAGLKPAQRSDSGLDSGLYSTTMSERTYQHLARLAETILKAGFNVIVDATFLKPEQRRSFYQLAKQLGIPFHILAVEAQEKTLRQRIASRHAQGSDASEADQTVLDQQLKRYTPLLPAEQPFIIRVNTENIVKLEPIVMRLINADE